MSRYIDADELKEQDFQDYSPTDVMCAIDSTPTANVTDIINRLKAQIEELCISLEAMRNAANSYKAECERLAKESADKERAYNEEYDLRKETQAEINDLKRQMEWLTGYNENLTNANIALSEEIALAKSEAYKEFAEKLKQHKRKMGGYDLNDAFWDYAVLVEDIDNLLKKWLVRKNDIRRSDKHD